MNDDKIKTNIIDYDDETNEVKIRLNLTYGVKSLEKETK